MDRGYMRNVLKGKAKKEKARRSIEKRALIRLIPIRHRNGSEGHQSLAYLRDYLRFVNTIDAM